MATKKKAVKSAKKPIPVKRPNVVKKASAKTSKPSSVKGGKSVTHKVSNKEASGKATKAGQKSSRPNARPISSKPITAAKSIKKEEVKKVAAIKPEKKSEIKKPEIKVPELKNVEQKKPEISEPRKIEAKKHEVILPPLPVKKPALPVKQVKLVIPEMKTKTSRRYEPEFTKSVLDQPQHIQLGPTMKYSEGELSEFRELIQKKLDQAKKELNYLQGLITRKDEMGGDENENRYMTMEDGSMSMEREQLAQMASRQINYIDHLEKAMMRIENKTYGICRVTGKLIDKARLRAVPHATLSIEAKQTMNR